LKREPEGGKLARHGLAALDGGIQIDENQHTPVEFVQAPLRGRDLSPPAAMYWCRPPLAGAGGRRIRASVRNCLGTAR
jgi:hypothetical protein